MKAVDTKTEFKKLPVAKPSYRHFTKSYDALSVAEVHDMFQLRSEVFVVEQDCVYQDIDGLDTRAQHLFVYDSLNLVAYARLFDLDIFTTRKAVIGRVVVRETYRGMGLGHDLIRFCLEALKNGDKTPPIKISAQKHLQKFYESHGFVNMGKEYLEDGIPHCEMHRA